MTDSHVRGSGVDLAFLAILLSLCVCSVFKATAGNKPKQPSNRDVYVSMRGDDSADGSERRPWLTIQHAASKVGPGATVHVAPGIYVGPIRTEAVGRVDARIIFVSDKKYGAKITGTTDDPIWLNSGNFVDIQGFDIAGRGYIGIENDASFVRIIGNHVHDLQVQCEPNGGAGIDNADYHASDNDVIGNTVEHIDGARDCAQRVHGIYQSNLRGHIWNNITAFSGGCGIHLWHAASNVTIANNLSFSNQFGICVGAGDAPGGIRNNDTLVANNIVVRNSKYGIFETGSNGDQNRFINNLVFGNNGGDFQLQHQAAATGTIKADPQSVFVNWKPDGDGDYHLKAGSPAIAMGTSSGAPPDDYEGISRKAKRTYDIGPFAVP